MPYNISGTNVYAECPCCGKVASGKQQIVDLFGMRTMENDDVIPQSYCRSCRSAHCEAGKPCKV